MRFQGYTTQMAKSYGAFPVAFMVMCLLKMSELMSFNAGHINECFSESELCVMMCISLMHVRNKIDFI